MTPKQEVLKKYPKAFCEMNGHYVQIVSPLPYGEVKILGVAMGWNRGHYFKAWADAARNMKARPDGR